MRQNWIPSRLKRAKLPLTYEHQSALLLMHLEEVSSEEPQTLLSDYTASIAHVLRVCPKETKKEVGGLT